MIIIFAPICSCMCIGIGIHISVFVFVPASDCWERGKGGVGGGVPRLVRCNNNWRPAPRVCFSEPRAAASELGITRDHLQQNENPVALLCH